MGLPASEMQPLNLLSLRRPHHQTARHIDAGTLAQEVPITADLSTAPISTAPISTALITAPVTVQAVPILDMPWS